jgi:hypothetical protein
MLPFQLPNLNTFLEKENIKAYIQEFGKEFFLFSFSTICFQASRFIVAMIVARWVGQKISVSGIRFNRYWHTV